MTALTAVRTNLNEAATDRDVRMEGTPRYTSKHQQHRSRQRIIEELHPELLLNQKKKRKEKLRYKTPSLPATIEDASEDEESATTSDCSSSTSSLDGRSPHVLPPEELFSHSLPANQVFFSHPLISPKLGRRTTTSLSLRGAKSTSGLKREFSDVIVRKKRSLSSLGERLNNISFDSLPADFLNLPPIPEAVSVQKTSEKKKSSLTEEEEEEEDEGVSEVNVAECSDCSISS